MEPSADCRVVAIQLQRFVPQLATVLVAIPPDWDDEKVKGKLSDIYEAFVADLVDVEWHDQEDFDRDEAREGTHELDSEPPRGYTEVDLVYPEQEDSDGNDD